jgi:nodulation protein E
MNRVAVTGLGIVSPVGSDLESFWQAVAGGRSGIVPLTIVGSDRLKVRHAAQVGDFDPHKHFDDKRLSVLDRFAQFALVAARAAVRDARLVFDDALALRTATIIGSGVGGQNTQDDSFRRLYGEKNEKVHPMAIPRQMLNAAASQISIEFGLKGPAYAVATACASGSHAIGQAFHMIRAGSVPVAVTGGSEACLTFGTIKAWEALRVLSHDTCRPFSLDRGGLVLGEGAAVVVLESFEHARARGAVIHAEIVGFGMSADAADVTAPSLDGAVRAITAALADAGARSESVDYVNAHGTGTLLNDRVESAALHQVFGASVKRLAVSSTKGVLGHGLGAAGALECVVTAMALARQVIPPTANFTVADPECDLDVVPNEARAARVELALSNSFAFGGLNAVLALKAVH